MYFHSINLFSYLLVLNIDGAGGRHVLWKAWSSWFESDRRNDFFAYMLKVRSGAFLKLTQLSKRMCNHCVKIHVVHVMFLSLFPRSAVWFGHETIVCQEQRSTHQATDVTFPWVSRIECFVFNASFIGRFTKVEMNAIERTLHNSCSQSLARKTDS